MVFSRDSILYIILLILFIILCFIYIKHINYSEKFIESSDPNINQNPLLTLDTTDIHFIKDDTIDLIESIIFNYKLKTISKDLTSNSLDNNLEKKQKISYISVFSHKSATINNTVYRPLGQYVIITDSPITNVHEAIQSIINKKILCHMTSSNITTKQYSLIWTSDYNEDREIFSIWRPICPVGATSIGDIIVSGLDTPTIETPCIPFTMLNKMPLSSGIIWHSINDAGVDCYCWGASNMESFRASKNYGKDISTFPDLDNVYNIPLQFLTNNTIVTEKVKNGITI